MTPPGAAANQEAVLSSLGAALLVLVAHLVLGTVFQALMLDTRNGHGLSPDECAAIGQLLSAGMVVATLLTLRGFGHRSLFHAGDQPLAGVAWATTLPVLMLVPGLLVLGGWLDRLLMQVFPLSAWESTWFDSMVDGSLVTLVSVCVLAPVLEETLFRGLLLRGFLLRYPPSTAIVHSAAVFGLAHFNVYQFCAAFLIGLILGEIYRRHRSLLPCILLHGAYNASVLWLSTPDDQGRLSPVAQWLNEPTVIAAALLAGAWAAGRLLGWPAMKTRRP